MLNLCAASIYFLLIHFGVSGTRLRQALVARLGEGAYRGLLSLASLVGLAWLIHAYHHAPAVPLWGLVLTLRLAAYALWALAHLVVSGNLASLVLFGSLLVLAIGGSAFIDAKRQRASGVQWSGFAGATSAMPFAAIASGRNRLAAALREIGPWRPLVVVLVYAVVFYLHGRLGCRWWGEWRGAHGVGADPRGAGGGITRLGTRPTSLTVSGRVEWR